MFKEQCTKTLLQQRKQTGHCQYKLSKYRPKIIRENILVKFKCTLIEKLNEKLIKPMNIKLSKNLILYRITFQLQRGNIVQCLIVGSNQVLQLISWLKTSIQGRKESQLPDKQVPVQNISQSQHFLTRSYPPLKNMVFLLRRC